MLNSIHTDEWVPIIWIAAAVIVVVASISGYYMKRNKETLSNEEVEKIKEEKEREIQERKIKFLTYIAHRIRTPLDHIKAPLDSIRQSADTMDTEDFKRNLEVITTNVDRLLSLSDKLLEAPTLTQCPNLCKKEDQEEITREFVPDKPENDLTSKSLNKVDEEFLSKINYIIEHRYENPAFSMDDVISEMGMSRTSFYRRVKGLLDTNLNDYIKSLRLGKAAQLFNEGHNNVSEVCYQVGFSSPSYFTRCFRVQFGISPREYISFVKKCSETD